MREISYVYLPDEQLEKARGRIIAGEGNFEITDVNEGHSKNGNPQIIIDFKVYDCQGTQGLSRDYLPLTESCAWKMRAFLLSIGLPYEKNGKLNLDLLENKTGRCKLKLEKYLKDGNEKESIKIESYLIPSTHKPVAASNSSALPDADVPDDDLPF